MILKKIDPMSLAKFFAIYGAIVGAITGLIMFISSLVVTSTVNNLNSDLGTNSPQVAFGTGFGILSIIIMPALYALGGFIGGLIFAFIFNLIARLSGGIKLELETANNMIPLNKQASF